MSSAYRSIALGALPRGGLIGGITARAFGIRAPFYLGAAVLPVLVVVLASVSPTATLDAFTR